MRHCDLDAMLEGERIGTVVVDGEQYVPDRELTRLLDERAVPKPQRITGDGDGDDWLSVSQAAGLLGVSACRHDTCTDCANEDQTRLRATGVAQLLSERSGDAPPSGSAADLAEFAPPVACVGYDVTLTPRRPSAW
jgi:hypothetical protein